MKHLFNFVLIAILATCLSSCESCKKDEPPIFTINASAIRIVVGQSVTFSQNAIDWTSSQWDLPGSATPSVSGISATTSYSQPGTYTVTATVRNNDNVTVQSFTIFVELGVWSFEFPGGQDNNNQTIGDFCCTGQTHTVLTSNNTPIGYAYFFTWQGQAYNINNTSIAPNFEILISGATDLEGVTTRATTGIFFADFDCVIGRTKTVRVGNLEYRAEILEIAYPFGTQYVNTHFYMDTLKVRLTVKYVP